MDGVDGAYQTRIEGTMLVWGSVLLDIVEESVGNFENGLVRNVLVGPAEPED